MKSLIKILLLMASAGVASAASAAQILVFAASSLAEVLQKAAPEFTRETGHTVRFNFAGSGALLRQVKEGAPADVFISADALRVDQLEQDGLGLPGSRRELWSNTLVLIVEAAEPARIATLSDLRRPEIRRIAIGEPATVPVGTYTKDYLRQVELWTPLLDKFVPVENVRAALSAVAAGNAQAGFVYRTDARSSSKVRIVLEFPAPDGPGVLYPGVVLRESKEAEVALAYLRWLQSEPANRIFAAAGFGLVPPPP